MSAIQFLVDLYINIPVQIHDVLICMSVFTVAQRNLQLTVFAVNAKTHAMSVLCSISRWYLSRVDSVLSIFLDRN